MQLSLISTDDLVLYLFSNKGMEVSNISTGKQVLIQRGCDGSVHLPPPPPQAHHPNSGKGPTDTIFQYWHRILKMISTES